MVARRSLKQIRRQRRASDELRNEILQAASELFLEEGYQFLEEGYQGTSVEAVIAKVGGSKRAIYSHFGGKKELFEALVMEASNKALEGLMSDELGSLDLESTLVAFGRQVTQVIMSPATVALYRVVVAEGTRLPDVARLFFDKAPGRASRSLAKILDHFRERGQIEVDDSQRAAERFTGMLRDDLHLRVVLGLSPPPTEQEIEKSVQQAVQIYLGGIASNKRRPLRRK
jgi:AcrR family transcriptional regulator